MKKTPEELKAEALRISNKFPFSPVPPPTDEQGNIIVVKSDLDEEFMRLLEEGKDLDFLVDGPDDHDKWPL